MKIEEIFAYPTRTVRRIRTEIEIQGGRLAKQLANPDLAGTVNTMNYLYAPACVIRQLISIYQHKLSTTLLAK